MPSQYRGGVRVHPEDWHMPGMKERKPIGNYQVQMRKGCLELGKGVPQGKV